MCLKSKMKPKPFQKQCVIHIALLRFGEGFGDFTSAVAQEHILQGITRALQVDAITKEVAHLALKLPAQKVRSMEHVMQIHAINQLFFEELPPAKLQRYNRILNLQWAMDVKEQMN